jgi:molecular chaperone DnaJ
MKDYYKIMNVPYDATTEDIRRAYHRLAKKYHPDKNPGDTYAAAAFVAVQEAYEILSDRERRQQFHVRSHYPMQGRKAAQDITSNGILHKCKKLNQQIATTGRYRLSSKLILQSINHILSEKNIAVLLQEDQRPIIDNIINQLLVSLKGLPYRQIPGSIGKLLLLAGNHPAVRNQVLAFSIRKRKNRYWEDYNIGIIVFATVLICLLILFLST